MRRTWRSILIIAMCSVPFLARGLAEIKIVPAEVQQGEPVMIQVIGATLDGVAKVSWNGKSLWFFNYKGAPTAFYGIDLNASAGDYKIAVKMEDGSIIDKIIPVKAREKVEAPLGIPEKLGGNTEVAATNLVNNLAKENGVINGVFSAAKKYWPEGFRHPMKYPVVTDTYGYLRKTGYYNIPHKGTDYRAEEGYRVYAVNGGVVRLSRTFTIYGKAVAIDHGLGVVSYYMHLSRINVKEGQKVTKGQVIGLSGSSGYAEGPHLHLSIKINGISIDPYKFISLFETQ